MLPHRRDSDRGSVRTAALAFIILASLAGCSRSQEPNMPSPAAESATGVAPESVLGERSRVREATPGSPVVESIGIVEGLTRDSVRLDTDLGVRRVALSPTVRLEISRGIHANTGRGAWMGALIGGFGLGVVGAFSCDGTSIHPFDTPSGCALVGAVLGGAGGALIGLGVGALIKTERWEEVHPEPGILPGGADRQTR